MKISYKKEEKEFVPQEIKITVETKDELLQLWHLTNVSQTGFKEMVDKSPTCRERPKEYNIGYTLWSVVDDLARELRVFKD